MESTKNGIVIGVVVVVLAVLGVFFVTRSTAPVVKAPLPEQENNPVEIEVAFPTPDAEIKSPLTVQGKARGSWFFEAIMGIKIIDANGNELASAPLNSQGEWMTSDFVPFVGTVPFKTSPTKTGFVVFMNDNPSGLPQYNKEFRVPVTFKDVGAAAESVTANELTLKVFFLKQKAVPAGEDECVKVFPVERKVAYTRGVARAAILELLKGNTTDEVAQGYSTSLNSGTSLKSIKIENGVAYADFDSMLDKNVGGACRTSSIILQIRSTLLQFPTVKDVKISRDGVSEYILQP